MFENRYEPLLSRGRFFTRLLGSFGVTLAIVTCSLFMGSAGYHWFGELPWIDALLNASMILAGMGPVDPMKSDSGKLFATFYALYSGIAFLSMMAVMVALLIHRMLHTFHLEQEESEQKDDRNNA